jgi:hypothetical protein
MTPYEQSVCKKLPDTVKIYRGMNIHEHKGGNYGISWTLSEKRADFFAHYFRNGNKESIIVSIDVPKDKIIAYSSSRKEKEILYVE